MEQAFDFGSVGLEQAPITLEINGTPHLYMKSIRYEKPDGKSERLEIVLEQQVGDEPAKSSTLYVLTPNAEKAMEEWYPKQRSTKIGQYIFLMMFYGKMTEAQARHKFQGINRFEQAATILTQSLQPGFDQIETTWALIFPKQETPMSIIAGYNGAVPFIKAGNDQTFAFNPKYDHVTLKPKAQPDTFAPSGDVMAGFGAPGMEFAPPMGGLAGQPQGLGGFGHVEPSENPF